MKHNYYTIIFMILFSNTFLYSQSFVKITSGEIVNDGGWCYGCNWADYNNDGYLDLFVVNNQTGNNNNLLYLNNGNGTFTKITSGVVVNDGGSSYGCTSGDFDNDGDVDLFVANYGQNNFLYSNNGNGTFTKVTAGAIVNDGGNSTGCSWGDYDNDGYIDLFVCNRNQSNFLYRNNGNGTFTKITTGPVATDVSNSGGCAWGDYNNDNYMDLFVANAGPANDFLYRNNGNGTFTKITNDPVVTDIAHSSGGNWGDYDNDVDLDLFVSGGVIGTGNDRLFRNNGNGSFTKIVSDPIVNNNHWAGGSGWADFDNDGDIDMFVGGYDGNNFLFTNNGNGSFTQIDTGVVVFDGGYKMGASWCDYDNDGDIDLFAARNNFYGGNNVLYMNLGNNSKWVNIRCIGMVSNKSGIGAKIYVKAVINSISKRQLQQVTSQSGGSISGQGSMNVEFGLGNASVIDSVRIEWPSGIIDKYANIAVNQFVTAIEGQSLVPVELSGSNVPKEFYLFQNYPNPFNPSTSFRFEISELRYVKLIIYNVLGEEKANIVNEELHPGIYEVKWDAANYPSGVYYFQLSAGYFRQTRKMILLK